MADRYDTLRRVYGAETFNQIQKANILVVGAGGIGCEVLKTLVMSGFEKVETIDLDTIDVSNLNRQFLFRKGHVGKGKAVVAAQTAGEFNPRANIVAYQANVKTEEYGKDFFQRFDVVVSALDNLDARMHINRLCVKLDLPLIESGTRGYEGHVQPIGKGHECFDCDPKANPRTFAVCTIRSFPTQMVHCVVHAKIIYARIFGMEGDDDSANLTWWADLQAQSTASGWDDAEVARRVCDALHRTDILTMLELKSSGTEKWPGQPPVALEATADVLKATTDDDPLSVQCQVKEFVESFVALRARTAFASFDKDDALAVRFVAAASNLRAHVYHIARQNAFDIKAIAGNIIPAIATTNAIISGNIVSELIKMIRLGGKLTDCRRMYVSRVPYHWQRKNCFVFPSRLDPPRPNCIACDPNRCREIGLRLDTRATTLGYLVKHVVKGHFCLAEPCIDVGASCIYDEESGPSEESLSRYLVDCGLGDKATCVVSDLSQDLEFTAVITHVEGDPSEFKVVGQKVEAKKSSEAVVVEDGGDSDPEALVECVPLAVRRANRKAAAEEPEAKRRKLECESVD